VRRLPVVLLLAVVVLAGCSANDPSPDQAAVVNGATISLADVSRRVTGTKAAMASTPQSTQPGQPAQADGVAITRRVLGDLIRAELVTKAAAKDGVRVTPAQIEQRISEIRAQLQAQGQKFDDAVAAEGLTLDTLRDRLRLDAAATGVIGRLVPDVTDAQVQAEVTRRKGEPEAVKARHILVGDEATARKVRDQLEAGGDWKALASQFSTDPGSKVKGGELGEITRGQTVPEFDQSLFTLAGQGNCKGAKGACTSPLSQPVKTQFGYHILQVTGVKPRSAGSAKAITAESVKAELTQQLQSKREQAYSAWIAELTVGADVKVNPRFGVWQASSGTITDRDTAPQAPPTSMPAIQLGGDQLGGGQAPAAP
jgi:foldase protein PrsA